jgi:hypothetical protein
MASRLSTSSVNSTTSASSATIHTLANGWKQCRDETTGDSYFYSDTGVVTWDEPEGCHAVDRDDEGLHERVSEDLREGVVSPSELSPPVKVLVTSGDTAGTGSGGLEARNRATSFEQILAFSSPPPPPPMTPVQARRVVEAKSPASTPNLAAAVAAEVVGDVDENDEDEDDEEVPLSYLTGKFEALCEDWAEFKKGSLEEQKLARAAADARAKALSREKADRERANRAKADKERADKERADKERVDKEKADRDKARAIALARDKRRKEQELAAANKAKELEAANLALQAEKEAKVKLQRQQLAKQKQLLKEQQNDRRKQLEEEERDKVEKAKQQKAEERAQREKQAANRERLLLAKKEREVQQKREAAANAVSSTIAAANAAAANAFAVTTAAAPAPSSAKAVPSSVGAKLRKTSKSIIHASKVLAKENRVAPPERLRPTAATKEKEAKEPAAKSVIENPFSHLF